MTPVAIQSVLAFALSLAYLPPPASQAGPATAPTRPSPIPITYIPYGNPRALTAAQEGEIRLAIKEHCPNDRTLWFVRVRHNDGISYRATVYLSPDRIDGRFSQGRSFYIDSLGPPRLRKDLGTYTHIAPTTSRFPDIPAPADVPMHLPKDIPAETLIKIVDATRSALAREHPDDPMPILEITPHSKDQYKVRCGWIAGPLNARGRDVHLKPEGDSFSASIGAGWIS